MNKKNLRNQLINNILFESGEIVLNEGRPTRDSGLPLSQRFYNAYNKDTGALPNFSQKSYKYDNEYDLKSTRFGFTAKDKAAIRNRGLVYCAVATEDDNVVLGMCDRDVKDIIVQHSADLFLKEKYGLTGGHYGVRRDLPSIIIDKLGTRFISLDEYEQTLIEYLTEDVYPKKVNRYLRNIKDEDEEEMPYNPAAAHSRFMEKMRQRKEAARMAREERRNMKKMEDQKWYDSQIPSSTDPLDTILNQIRKQLEEDGKDEIEININLNAHRKALQEMRELYAKYTFGTRGDYMSNGLLNVLNMRYGLRTIMWPDSFWNAKNS